MIEKAASLRFSRRRVSGRSSTRFPSTCIVILLVDLVHFPGEHDEPHETSLVGDAALSLIERERNAVQTASWKITPTVCRLPE